MERYIPKKFLSRFSLTTGALVFGNVFIIVKAVCLIVTIVEMVEFSYCNTNCTDFVTNNSYGFNATAIIYCVIMILVHLCFIWAIKKKRPIYIIGWVAITTLWLIKTVCLTIVLLFLYSRQTSFTIFIVCTIFAIIGLCIAIYALLIGVGLWKQMLPSTARNP